MMKGRRTGLVTADRVRGAMGLAPIGPAFRREVGAFLSATGTEAYVLGEAAAGDPSFVGRLHRGASFRLATVDRVRGWMAGAACEAGLRAMRRAVAGAPFLDTAPGATPGGTDHGTTWTASGAGPATPARRWRGCSGSRCLRTSRSRRGLAFARTRRCSFRRCRGRPGRLGGAGPRDAIREDTACTAAVTLLTLTPENAADARAAAARGAIGAWVAAQAERMRKRDLSTAFYPERIEADGRAGDGDR